MNPIKKLVELYRAYREYVRVDLIVYGVMIVLVILYAVFVQFS